MGRNDDDPLFAGILSWWAVLGLGTALALAAIEPRPMFEELPDAWVRVADNRPKARIARPVPTTVEVRAAPRESPKSPAGPAKPRRGGRTLLDLVGTRGEGKTEFLARVLEGGVGEVDLSEATSGSTVDDRLRDAGSPDGPADVELGALHAGTSDGADLGVPVTVRARAPALAEPPAGSTRRLPQAQIGGILYCYEKRLMTNPDLVGRIEIAFAGRPTVVVNDTGDAELASCIDRLARRWTVAEGFDTDATYPVVLRPK